MGPWRFFLDFGRIAGVGRMRVQGALYEPAVPAAFLHYASHGHPCRQDLRSRRALTVLTDQAKSLRLRRINRIHTIRGSLAIKGNQLSEHRLQQSQRKTGHSPASRYSGVRNALAAYERFDTWRPGVEKDLLEAIVS
jgi:hypothetical protein